MASLFKRSKDSKSPSGSNGQLPDASRDEALPAYTPVATSGVNGIGPVPDDVDISGAFANLSISPAPQDPTVETCLAHLKLLFAIQSMKEDIGYTDGLWNIWDSRASKDELPANDPALEALSGGSPSSTKLTPEDEKKILLSKIREKRWAVFVARAVDRYEAWWNTLDKQMLREADMTVEGTASYTLFPSQNNQMPWTPTMLPPLDVLMVMHAHMLNPRSFLEDTMRNGLSAFWSTGMPWHVVNAAIDTSFSYNASDETKAYWVSQTGRSWENTDDAMTKSLKCPACGVPLEIPWTTCGLDEECKDTSRPGLTGFGYGDGEFLINCPSCYVQVDKELLSVAKFVRDAKDLLAHSITMPGTILDPSSGMPQVVPSDVRSLLYGRTFPNRMIQKALRIQIIELIQPGISPRPTMETVRDKIESVLGNNATLKAIDGFTTFGRRYVLGRDGRISVRKMMARYWENFSPFALDLGGAVLRQGVFTEKMHRIDWLHSPSARETMVRLIRKYDRFLDIMATHPTKTAVPTLDVDLAWHTHQLSPSAYYRFTVQKTSKFINHDDKIDEDKLGEAFEWTSKVYQEQFGAVYSECTCWYCETIRAAHVSSVGKLLRVSNNEKIADAFHDSGAARLCPPDNSAHISAHNAVKLAETNARSLVTKHVRLHQQQRLEANYQKAVKRAEKKGRKLPPRDQYYDHWGYAYFMYSPFIYPLYFTPGIYAGWDPYCTPAGAGAWANCAAGSCGNGGVAAGACGGPGGCGNPGGCGTGSAGGCSGGAGCGGGGGGCGGGGGGCGGGGGGCGGGGS